MRSFATNIGVIVTVTILAHAARGDDFRIETKVFSGRDKNPVSTNTTLFHNGYVYDYLSGPDRVAVFDQPHGRFILLDPEKKTKTIVKTEDVQTFASLLHEQAAKSSSAFKRFAADPQFDTHFEQNGELMLTSPHMTYRLLTEPAASVDAANQYREFSDWYTRFNAMSNVGSTPPFARLAVNEELARRGLVAREVQLTIPAQSALSSRATSMRSEHFISWRLLERDLERISDTANHLTTFKQVEFSEFQSLAVSQK